MEYEENDNPNNIVSDPSAALYYGSSAKLRESGIIPELSRLDKSDTIWIIRFLQRQLEKLKTEETRTQVSEADPMYGLHFLRSIHEGLPDPDELKNEYLQEKFGI